MAHMPTFANSSQPTTIVNDEATAIVICTPVYSDSATGVKRAIATSSGTATVVGLISSSPSIAAGATGTIVGPGEYFTATTAQWDAVAGTSGGLAFNTVYYLSTTAGRITSSAPTSPNVTAAVCVALSSTTVLVTLAGSGGSGSGITNSASANVLMKSDGTNAVASRVTDDGTFVNYAGLWNLNQTVTNAYPIGEIFRMTLAPGSGFTTGATGDIFAVVIRNHTLFDTTAGGNASGGAYFEVTSTKSAGSNQLVNKSLELLASGADVNYAIHVTGGDIISDTSGGLYVTAGPAQLTQTVTLGDATHDVSCAHNLSVFNQLLITGPGSTLYAIQVTKGIISAGDINGASGFGVLRANGQNGQDCLQLGCPNDGGGHAKFWSLYMSGQDIKLFEYAQTANGSGGTATSGSDRVFFKAGGDVQLQTGKVCSFGGFAHGATGTGPKWTVGAGSPAGVVTGSPGDLYSNTSGGASTTLYVKESGTATTGGWVAK